MLDKPYVYLTGGLGNRLNNIFNYIGEDVQYIWPLNGGLNAVWEDLFQPAGLDITYESPVPSTPNYAWSFNRAGDAAQVTRVQRFISNLKPSAEVSKLMVKLPEGTDGYAIRLLHPRSLITEPVSIPKNAFMATDSQAQKNANPQTLQVIGDKGLWDGCPNIRNREGVVRAAAEWFTLLSCSTIYTIGCPFKSITDTTHTTFVDAHRILGKDVVDLTG
jgi:hypothetical protein